MSIPNFQSIYFKLVAFLSLNSLDFDERLINTVDFRCQIALMIGACR